MPITLTSKLARNINLFCWGLMYHFIGLNNRSTMLLKSIDQKSSNGITKQIRKIAAGIISLMSTEELDAKGRRETLKEINQTINEILKEPFQGKGPLSSEFGGHDDESTSSVDEKSAKGLSGWSRNPFRDMSNDKEPTCVAFAASLYLLRAYARLFSVEKRIRGFDVIKKCLNDCFQSYQFVWRLYSRSEYCHHNSLSGSTDYTVRVCRDISKLKGKRTPSDKVLCVQSNSFFSWSMFNVIEVMRGNMYYQAEFFDSALEHYTEALTRSLAVHKYVRRKNSMKSAEVEYIESHVDTLTMIKARFERSKISYEQGNLLSSLNEQLRCIRALIVSESRNRGKPLQKVIKNLNKAIRFLSLEEHAPVWNKTMIGKLFGFLEEDTEEIIRSDDNNGAKEIRRKVKKSLALLRGASGTDRRPLVTAGMILNAFGNNNSSSRLSSQTQSLLANILSRIGFALLTLRVETKDKDFLKSGFLEEWLRLYFHPRVSVIDKDRWAPLGRYCWTIVSLGTGEELEPDAPNFDDILERQIALGLREKITELLHHSTSTSPDNARARAFAKLLDATTHNIGNLVTIPLQNQRFLMRQSYRGIKTNDKPKGKIHTEDKLVVLRRWQSSNPKLPRPHGHRLRGGGYLLYWQGKGIAIDPGYDFVQNLYDEGFCLSDIDAIIISHAHPDHDDDLATLLTMLHEWNERQEIIGKPSSKRKVDLFMNVSSFQKFSAWTHSEHETLLKIIPLPQVTWDKNSDMYTKQYGNGIERIGPRRGKNTIIDLRGPDGYNMELEIVPAWHDDVLNKTQAVGFIFHLYKAKDCDQLNKTIPSSKRSRTRSAKPKPVCRIGYTGDTGAYGIEGKDIEGKITDMYAGCDILVAHLGDARIKEIATAISKVAQNYELIPVVDILRHTFCDRKGGNSPKFNKDLCSTEKVNEFINVIAALHLMDKRILKHKITLGSDDRGMTITEHISKMLKEMDGEPQGEKYTKDSFHSSIVQFIGEVYKDHELPDVSTPGNKLLKVFATVSDDIVLEGNETELDVKEMIYLLLGVLFSSCLVDWTYPYHLGIVGVEALFSTLYRSSIERRKDTIFVVGELPEELSSYRHHIAKWLNLDIGEPLRKKQNHKKDYRAYAFTGDIGLHIRVAKNGKYEPKIRCDYCNLNNETVAASEAYYEVKSIGETAIRALDSKIIYLCTVKEHHPSFDNDMYVHHLYKPEVKRI